VQAQEDADFQLSVGEVVEARQNGYAGQLMRKTKEE